MTIGILGTKGGLGTSTFALNLAAARVLAGENAIVADFRLGSGTIGYALGQPNNTGMANLILKSVAEIKPRVVETELFSHASGLRALLSSGHPREMQLHCGADMSVALLRNLRQLAKMTIIDLGSGYNSHFSNLQPELDQLVVVIDSNPITLSMARDLIREIESGHDTGKLHLVAINRTVLAGQVWHDVERYLGHPIKAALSPALELILQAHHANIPPILFQPAAMYATQVTKLADEIAQRNPQTPRTEPT
jgi:MinD-like ATPase involved in chromosome partitioning or flagellar assembly